MHKGPLLSALPTFLPTLREAIPVGHPLIDPFVIPKQHTVLPYLSYFHPKDDRDHWVERLANNDHEIPVAQVFGLTKYPVLATPKHPRFCMECIEEDSEKPGFSYFKREHQLPGVAYCWKHATLLYHGCEKCGPYPIKRHGFTMAGRCLCPDGISPLNAFESVPDNLDVMVWLARESAYMVASEGAQTHNYPELMRDALIQNGFSKGGMRSSSINRSRLADTLEKRFSPEVLSWLNCQVLINGAQKHWFKNTFINDPRAKVKYAIQNLILTAAVSDSLTEFESLFEGGIVDTKSESSKAMLPKSMDRDQKIIDAIKFGCTDMYKLSKLNNANYGQVFRVVIRNRLRIPLSANITSVLGESSIHKIIAALKKGTEKKDIISQFQCSKYSLICIEASCPGLKQEHSAARKKRLRRFHRKKLTAFLRSNPSATRTMAAKGTGGSYQFLIENDKEWFQTKTQSLRGDAAFKVHRSPNDWNQIDRLISDQLSNAFDDLYAEDLPMQVSKSRVLKSIGVHQKYYNHRKELPLTTAALEERVEPYDKFVERKGRWAINQLIKSNQPLNRKSLYRLFPIPYSRLIECRTRITGLAESLGAIIPSGSFFDKSKFES